MLSSQNPNSASNINALFRFVDPHMAAAKSKAPRPPHHGKWAHPPVRFLQSNLRTQFGGGPRPQFKRMPVYRIPTLPSQLLRRKPTQGPPSTYRFAAAQAKARARVLAKARVASGVTLITAAPGAAAAAATGRISVSGGSSFGGEHTPIMLLPDNSVGAYFNAAFTQLDEDVRPAIRAELRTARSVGRTALTTAAREVTSEAAEIKDQLQAANNFVGNEFSAEKQAILRQRAETDRQPVTVSHAHALLEVDDSRRPTARTVAAELNTARAVGDRALRTARQEVRAENRAVASQMRSASNFVRNEFAALHTALARGRRKPPTAVVSMKPLRKRVQPITKKKKNVRWVRRPRGWPHRAALVEERSMR